MTTCREGCGACCDPVAMPYTLDDLRRTLPFQLTEDQQADKAFALEHFTPIPRREGLAMVARYMSGGGVTRIVHKGQQHTIITHFFSCDMFDPETRECTAYDDRPPSCRRYPWYGAPPDASKALPPECSFQADVGATPVPLPTRRTP